MRYIIIILLFPVLSSGQACFVTDGMAFEYQDVPTTGRSLENHCISIYIETDLFTFQQHGSVSATKAWIDKLSTNIQTMFTNEQINVTFTDPHIPTTADWSEQYGSALDLLNAFGIVRKQSPGHLKLFATMRGLGGGIAWVNVLCVQTPPGNPAGPFSVMTQMTKTFPNYPSWSWNVGGSVHELGHLFGSRHTQDCVWSATNNQKIDDCVPGGSCTIIQPIERSTVMSYCHQTSWGTNLTLGFGTHPGNLIRQRVAAASCIEQSGSITLSGNVTGTYSSNIVNLTNANSTNLTLHSNEININNSTLNPLFTSYLLGCNN